MLHDFMSSVQSAQSQLSALCTCVEDYVDKMLFLDQYMAGQKALDAACTQVGSGQLSIGQLSIYMCALFDAVPEICHCSASSQHHAAACV